MSKHILVVDDEARIREVLQYALKKEGFTVTCVETGPAALEVVERGGVDLMVLDVMLPEMDGLEVCRRLRRTSRIPILSGQCARAAAIRASAFAASPGAAG